MDFSKRIIKEMYSICRDPPAGYSAELSKDPFEDAVDLIMIGPDGTPYEKGHFRLTLKFPDKYPLMAPVLKFITPVYHPNVDGNGTICISPLDELWTPSFPIAEILNFVRSMLANPQVEYFINAASAFEYQFKKDAFDETARDWTRRFAQPVSTENLNKLFHRISMLEKEEANYKNLTYL